MRRAYLAVHAGRVRGGTGPEAGPRQRPAHGEPGLGRLSLVRRRQRRRPRHPPRHGCPRPSAVRKGVADGRTGAQAPGPGVRPHGSASARAGCTPAHATARRRSASSPSPAASPRWSRRSPTRRSGRPESQRANAVAEGAMVTASRGGSGVRLAGGGCARRRRAALWPGPASRLTRRDQPPAVGRGPATAPLGPGPPRPRGRLRQRG